MFFQKCGNFGPAEIVWLDLHKGTDSSDRAREIN